MSGLCQNFGYSTGTLISFGPSGFSFTPTVLFYTCSCPSCGSANRNEMIISSPSLLISVQYCWVSTSTSNNSAASKGCLTQMFWSVVFIRIAGTLLAFGVTQQLCNTMPCGKLWCTACSTIYNWPFSILEVFPGTMKNYQWVKDKIEKLLAPKVICSSRFSLSVLIIVVPKGDGGKWLVINCHALNKVTRKFTWTCLKLKTFSLNWMVPNIFFNFGFMSWLPPYTSSSIPKMAFNSPFSKYEYVKVPFELAQAPAYFQELMTGILKDFNFAIASLDDIITFSMTEEKHLSHIKQVFKKLCTAKPSMKFSKCHFFTKEIQYLGHILSTTGIQPLPSKTQAIQNMHPPKTPKQFTPSLV